MTKGTLLSCIFLAACASVSAAIGKTEPELIELFGKVVQRQTEQVRNKGRSMPLGDRLVFKTDQWTIRATLISGHCEKLVYSKTGEWTNEEIGTILDTNGGKPAWREENSRRAKSRRDWKHENGATATWLAGDDFTITTPAYDATVSAYKEAALRERPRVPGF